MEASVSKKVSGDPDSARRDRPGKPEVQRPDVPNRPGPELDRPLEPGEPPEAPDEADGTPEPRVPRNPDERAPEKAPSKDERSDLADIGEADAQRGHSDKT